MQTQHQISLLDDSSETPLSIQDLTKDLHEWKDNLNKILLD